MTPEEKLSRIVRLLQDAGIDVLVMGGHAVRYYGIGRNTVDFDLVTSLSTPDEPRERLPRVGLLSAAREEPVWRHGDFARFEIGRLPNGQEEWLEFWLRNHLLADFASLKARAEIGTYGSEDLAFLSVADLIRSKETTRESDWQDIALLEEVQDARSHGAIGSSPGAVIRLLSTVRSRRGMDRAIEKRLLDDHDAVSKAMAAATHPITVAFLMPIARVVAGLGERPWSTASAADLSVPMDPALITSLSNAVFASPKHFALIEICRRAYKRRAMDLDRADKQAQLSRRRKTEPPTC